MNSAVRGAAQGREPGRDDAGTGGLGARRCYSRAGRLAGLH